ncbi:MAG TPA: type II toxin-antitoxin system ParD family antitoxin [Alphaproteobacteria bacterium]|nr:type II toxin-antitoxin system ParD family antitoxin [Alphaproteobacteria bacterium]
MANVEKISIALPPDMAGLVRAAVESGEYATTSEVIREALRDWKLKRRIAVLELDELRRLVREGMESGAPVPAKRVFDRLKGKYTAMARKVE